MRRLVRLYPARWRARYGDEFDVLLEAAGGGPRTALDVLRGVADAWVREARRRPGTVAPWVALVLCAIVVAWLDAHATDDVQPVAAALLVLGFAFGAYRPSRAWLYALVLFAGVPAGEVWARAADLHPQLLQDHPATESLIALVPVLAGAYAGAGLRWLVRAGAGDRP